jgi:transcriptional regulator with XRE-family HTH domain
MIDLKAFRKANSITQNDLAAFMGVGQGFISQIEKGDRPLPKEYISKLLANEFGWDTSMLQGEPSQPVLVAEPRANLSNVEILLRDMLAEKEAKIDALQEIIWELKEENGRLKEQLRAKGGDAGDAVNSSSAVA